MWRILAANHEGVVSKIGKSWRQNFRHFSAKKSFFLPGKMSEIFTPRFSNFFKKVKNHKENGLFRQIFGIHLPPAFSNFCFLSEKVKKMHDFWRHLYSKLAKMMESSKFDARIRHVVAPPCWKNLASNLDDHHPALKFSPT